MLNPQLIFLEAIALSVLGSLFEIFRDKLYRSWDVLDNLAIAVIVGIVCFAMLGEPTRVTAPLMMAAGYGGAEFLEWIFKPWWEAD